jgi:hypothetical protein
MSNMRFDLTFLLFFDLEVGVPSMSVAGTPHEVKNSGLNSPLGGYLLLKIAMASSTGFVAAFRLMLCLLLVGRIAVEMNAVLLSAKAKLRARGPVIFI